MNDLAQGVHANVTVFNVEADSYWTFLCSLIGNQNGCDGQDDYMCHVGVGMKSIMPRSSDARGSMIGHWKFDSIGGHRVLSTHASLPRWPGPCWLTPDL